MIVMRQLEGNWNDPDEADEDYDSDLKILTDKLAGVSDRELLELDNIVSFFQDGVLWHFDPSAVSA